MSLIMACSQEKHHFFQVRSRLVETETWLAQTSRIFFNITFFFYLRETLHFMNMVTKVKLQVQSGVMIFFQGHHRYKTYV